MNSTTIPTDLEVAFKAEHSGKFANVYKSVDGKIILTDVVERGDYVAMLCEFSDRPGDMSNNGVLNAMDVVVELLTAAVFTVSTSAEYYISTERNGNTVQAEIIADGAVLPVMEFTVKLPDDIEMDDFYTISVSAYNEEDEYFA